MLVCLYVGLSICWSVCKYGLSVCWSVCMLVYLIIGLYSYILFSQFVCLFCLTNDLNRFIALLLMNFIWKMLIDLMYRPKIDFIDFLYTLMFIPCLCVGQQQKTIVKAYVVLSCIWFLILRLLYVIWPGTNHMLIKSQKSDSCLYY